MGMKASATRESLTFIENMMQRAKTIKKLVRNTSSTWFERNRLTDSTSEVHRWMMSPVWWLTCQEKGSF